MHMTNEKPTKISLFGHFGSTNPGNEATLLAVVSRLRLLFPDCELCCICTSPGNVIDALDIDAVRHTVRTARIWDRGAPLSERVRLALPGLRDEALEYVRAWRALEGVDLLIVPGTGLLTDAWGLSGWGPYGLLKWSLMARLRSSRVVFLSVGAGPVHTRIARVLIKSALSLANYRSYRDLPSREVVECLGLRRTADRIYPDLVFGLSPASPPAPAAREQRTVVGLGLMEYAPNYSAPGPAGDIYGRYIDALAAFAGWLLEQGYEIKLLLGDADPLVIGDFRAALRERLGLYDEERVTAPPVGSVRDLLAQLGAVDVVVATRFHNVLMSLLLGKPSIAISFHHKVSSLMSEMGMAEYCHDIDRMNPDVLVEQFEALVRNVDELRDSITRRVTANRLALEEQYRLVFGEAVEEPALDEAIAAS